MTDREILKRAPDLAEWKRSSQIHLHRVELASSCERLQLTLLITAAEDLRYPGVARRSPCFCVNAAMSVYTDAKAEPSDTQTFRLCASRKLDVAIGVLRAALARATGEGSFAADDPAMLAIPERWQLIADFDSRPQSAEYQLNKLFSQRP